MDCCPNPKRSTTAVPRLPEDAVLEILARLPARSVHRFKCVSQRWCDLIADPVHRKRLPQTLEGFFCSDAEHYFYGEFICLPGITAPLLDPSFSFLTKLPGSTKTSGSCIPAMGSSSLGTTQVGAKMANLATLHAAFYGLPRLHGKGHLYCMIGHQEVQAGFYQSGISIWVLQDYDTEEWVLKQNVSFLKLFGQSKCRIHVDYNVVCRIHVDYNVVAIHPDCNWVFLVHHRNRKLIAYDMDSKKVHALRTFRHSYGFCTPYVPYYSELSVLANKH
ncbi:unnamed protein product [Urochloa decumbens]|uniref:F-box domain-containing protein n=1 Tax=Urochloa decumbens TaxID=240449 RepID=A0ABC8Z965_9POAL